ncbi:MAE_28990/MAE_18760 family HEPN-like nuclease [Pseudomonas sp. M47T1]|uniref:MAE_28990/MAE_18760 family HEPN-like nuclease n=1 Tax=Pseudomonas sp. M47T1 TaxID=1179778 RepID=UPI0012FAADA4|nr:MAE_28990/MAE_18760 family HEPN-like nuclease [Pseudomonas sp. M47T1]
MIESVKDEFARRSDEIDVLFSHIEFLAQAEDAHLSRVGNGIVPILSSSLCLMLYNQIESTAFSCVESIYDAIDERNVSFNSLVECFKKKILNDCKESYHSGSSLLKSLQGGDIAAALARASLKLDRVFSGNVDARKLREVLGFYNLLVTNPSLDNTGAELLGIKDARNSLAHGASSFEKYGRDLTVKDLRSARDNVGEYMAHIINLTDSYLERQLYLDPSSVA